MKVRGLILSIAAIASMTLFVAVDATAAEMTKVKFGMLKPNMVTVLHWIAMRTGAYEKNGIDLEEHPFPSGQSVAGVEELIRGNLDFYFGAGAEVARANSRSIELGKEPPLTVIQGATAGVTSIVLRKDLKGKTLDELKDMPLRIGISSPSSIHLALFRAALGDKGMSTDDLKWKLIKTSGGNMAPALIAGSLDGFMHSEPTTSIAINADAGFVFMNGRRGDLGETAKIIPMTLLSANREFAAKNPDVVERFLKALHDASEAFEQMPKEEIVKIEAEWAKQEMKIMGAAYERLDPRIVLDKQAADAWWNFIGATLKKRGSVNESVTFDQVFDLRYDQKAMKN